MQEFGLCIGNVKHYYPQAHAATVRIEDGDIEVGDKIHIVGKGADVWQTVRRIEKDHESIQRAQPGMSVGIEVDHGVPDGAEVYRFHS